MDKYILEIPNFIPSDICQAIIKRFENDGGKGEGSFTYTVGNRSVSQKKYNTELNIQVLSGWDDITTLFIEYTMKVYDEYLKHLKKKFEQYDGEYPIYIRELSGGNIFCSGFPIQRISKGDKYEWHHDGDINRPYFIQMIFYLNSLDESQGGCTEFIDGTKVRPEMGKVLVYPCSWVFPHTGNEVKHGYKYICTTAISIQTTQSPEMPDDH